MHATHATHAVTAPRVARGLLAIVALLLAPWLAVTTSATAAYGATTDTTILRVPLDFRLFLPCANDGAGEVVHLAGTFMMISHFTVDGSGGYHQKLAEIQQGVSGFGETTGDRYVSSFVNLHSFHQGSGSLPIISTQEVIYRINGPGRGNESLIRIRNHSTTNANGETTVAFDNFSAECLAESP